MKSKRRIALICHDIRSVHNVGSLLRTAEGLGVNAVFLTGYTPYPLAKHDERLPHIAQKLTKQISKTALGAEQMMNWQHADIQSVIKQLKKDGYTLVGLEQASSAITLPSWQAPESAAILLGREVEGIDAKLLKQCDVTVEIPMYGKKESFNVVQAAAMALFYCRFI